jgi:hypothetical protein
LTLSKDERQMPYRYEDPGISELIDNVLRGQIRVPAFQRGFIWDADMVAFFIDSIYKGYPFGSLLFWRTKEPLKYEKNLGPFALPERRPDYPIDYVLDGQQRITSIFGVFQTRLDVPHDWLKIYFDYTANPDAQESQFFPLKDSEVDLEHHFPLNCLFDSAAYRKATRNLDDSITEKIDRMLKIFTQARIPIQILATEEKPTVSIVFERVNRRGVPLDTLQLLSAWTWSDEFDLQQKFKELKADLEPFGFEEVGEDTDLLLRCFAAVLSNDSLSDSLVNINGSLVRERFQEIVNGLQGAIDFLRKNIMVYKLDNLPFATALIPLTVFFSIPGNSHFVYTNEQKEVLLKWFWRCCFSRRYSSGTRRNLNADIGEILKLKEGKDNHLGEFDVSLKPEFFVKNNFRIGTVDSQSFILLLAQKQPLSFISGSPITLEDALRDCNRNEFHHIYPRAYLRDNSIKDYDTDCLANICFLSRAENKDLGGVSPGEYRAKMSKKAIDEILKKAICPLSIFDGEYKKFIDERSIMLVLEANELMELSIY